MKGLLALLLVAALAFAGCTGKGTTTSSSSSTTRATTSAATTTTAAAGTTTAGPTTTTAATTTTTSTTTTTTSSPPQNRAPVIGAFVASRPNTTTLSFTFHFTATDADRDPLNWTLDANGDGALDANGTRLPGNATYTYAAPGLFNATLRVRDGRATTSQILAVNATRVTTSGPVLFTASGNTTVPPNPLMLSEGAEQGAIACTGFGAGVSGRDCVFFTVNETIEGHPFTAVSSAGNADVDMYDICSPTGTQVTVPHFDNAGNESGTVPAGVGCIIIWDGTATKIGTMTFTVR